MTETTFDLTKALAKSHAFYGLEPHQLELVETLVTIREVEPEEVVVSIDSRDTDLYIVLEGELRVMNSRGDVLADLCPGASVGEVSLLDQQPRSATVIAKQASIIAVIPALELWLLMDRRPDLGSTVLFNIGRVLATRLRSANDYRSPN